jgi:GNAT superfamily N-acetyltransferase
MSQENVEVVCYRVASATDAAGIANLHAESWRRHYRGAYSDAFLDYHVLADRRAVWTERMHRKPVSECTLIAEADRRIIGFAHTILGDDAKWGALLENLHVTRSLHRRGVGTELMARTAHVALERTPSQGIYLWVLEQNAAAQGFYRALGGTSVERGPSPAPGGCPERLAGSPFRLRFVWSNPEVLLTAASALKAAAPDSRSEPR